MNKISYNHKKIERKWQKKWTEVIDFSARDKSKKKKMYILVEFPFPSGEGLHVGHCRSYVGLDIIARKKRMEGYNVLFPMGWDAFGLPTENRAIKSGIPPQIVTKKNTANFKRQEIRLGLSFDWKREINTTDPNYYKWTQWIFIQLYKHGLAYRAKMPINWCPSCRIGLANEEVINGCCERCGAEVIKKEKEQWMLKITKYADRLIDDLSLIDYPEKVKIAQKEWIGRSNGLEIDFSISTGDKIKVFTTRPDTLFGATYLVIAPEHPILEKIKWEIINLKAVESYIRRAKQKAERERLADEKEKSGIELRGIKAINPANNREMPIFVADYVLLNYGTGAIMAVPAHDQRDFEFAKKYNLPIKEVIKPIEGKKYFFNEKAYEGPGILINSGRFNGLDSEKAKEKIGQWLKKNGFAREAVYYKLRDWVFSRQRYWGEPIPIIYCRDCWEGLNDKEKRAIKEGVDYVFIDGKEHLVNLVPEKDLPVILPKIKEYKPSESGDSPLIKAKNWVNVSCPVCGALAKRETDVMPNWAGSNWYYLRYCDPYNDKKLADPNLLKYWMPVDWYNGGMEHTTLHLLYSRFIYKFLWDIGAVPKTIGPEPYRKRTSHGMVLAEGGIKMSKSKGNVVNPDDIMEEYGADSLRIYEMFMGPFEQSVAWDKKGLKGVRRFLEKIWVLGNGLIKNKRKGNYKKVNKVKEKELKSLLHKTIKKVGEDIDLLKFNTAVSALMEFGNAWAKSGNNLAFSDFKDFLKILSPFAPYLSSELWEKAGFSGICLKEKWPVYDRKIIEEKIVNIIVQINGKVRDKIEIESGLGEEEIKRIALSREKVRKWIGDKKIKMVVFVPNKIINIVI